MSLGPGSSYFRVTVRLAEGVPSLLRIPYKLISKLFSKAALELPGFKVWQFEQSGHCDSDCIRDIWFYQRLTATHLPSFYLILFIVEPWLRRPLRNQRARRLVLEICNRIRVL